MFDIYVYLVIQYIDIFKPISKNNIIFMHEVTYILPKVVFLLCKEFLIIVLYVYNNVKTAFCENN